MLIKYVVAWAALIAATTFESWGDATIRVALFDRVGLARLAVFGLGALLLFGYGVMLNLAPLPFERVVGLYIATLFVIWQGVSYVSFRAIPSGPILLGGALIIAGGLIVTFWDQNISR